MRGRTFASRAPAGRGSSFAAPVRPFGAEPAGAGGASVPAKGPGHDFARVSVAGAPIQRVVIPAEERIRPDAFMQARAHLAARFVGAPVGELRADIDRGREMVNQWDSTRDHPVTPHDSDALFASTRQEHYIDLKRFQSEAGHYRPRNGSPDSAFQQVRNLHGEAYGELHEPDYPGVAFIGARHTKGYNESPFVSLLSEPKKLLESKDTGEKGAQTIAQKAAQLHTYTVPKHFTWSTDRLASTMYEEDRTGPIDNSGQEAGEWLGSTPKEEGEELFLGGDLNRYRTKQEANPFLKRKGRRN